MIRSMNSCLVSRYNIIYICLIGYYIILLSNESANGLLKVTDDSIS